MGSKNDIYYIQQAILEINYIIEYTKDLSYYELLNDVKTIDATMFRLQQMIEKIKNISQDYKNIHNEIPWGDIIGFRNGIVHDYGKTDYTTVYEIITKDVYQLKELFENSLLEEQVHLWKRKRIDLTKKIW